MDATMLEHRLSSFACNGRSTKRTYVVDVARATAILLTSRPCHLPPQPVANASAIISPNGGGGGVTRE